MSKELPHMWSYWRDKKGLKEALVDYFSETLKSDLRLQQALAQIQTAEAAIEAVFAELREAQDEP